MKETIMVALLGIIILTILIGSSFNFACAEYIYSCSMQILDMENQYLPTPAVPYSNFQKELKLQIANHTGFNDRYMILCVLNGEALQFSTLDFSNVKQAFYNISAYDELEIPIKININKLTAEDNVLHIMCIGLLDWIPKDNYDFFSYFSNTISIPISFEGYADGYSNIEYYEGTLEIAPEIVSSLKRITFISDSGKIDDSIQIQYYASVDGFKLDCVIYSNSERICALFFLDNQLIEINGKDSVVLQAATDSVYCVKQTIPITDGTHQMYAVWLPLDLNQPAFASSTEKIVIKTMGEGENE